MVRAKFRLNSYTTQLSGKEELRTLNLSAVYDDTPENKEFFKWTPNGEIKIGVLNKKAWEAFTLGEEYYVDFSPVKQPDTAMSS